jgi:phospholipase C
VYTFRSSGYWNDTLLVITYDEHGGFFGHVPLPNFGVTSPDGLISPNGFDFSRLGVRVPTFAISPWYKAGTLVIQPSPLQKLAPISQFESTSITSTANKIFGVFESLTHRDAWAATFEDVISNTLRSDCLVEMPAVRPLSQQQI